MKNMIFETRSIDVGLHSLEHSVRGVKCSSLSEGDGLAVNLDDLATKFAKIYSGDSVTILIPSDSVLNHHIAGIVMSKCKDSKLLEGIICKLTTEEVDEIVLDFNSKFREYYKDDFNTKYFELGKYLDLMDKEREGYFSRHLIENDEMRNVLDFTLKTSTDRFAEFANNINDQNILIIDSLVTLINQM